MFATWSPQLAVTLAKQAGLGTLDGHHWKVITAAREEAARCGCRPNLRRIEELTGYGPGELHHLFPGHTASLIARLAGYAAHGSNGSRPRASGHKEER